MRRRAIECCWIGEVGDLGYVRDHVYEGVERDEGKVSDFVGEVGFEDDVGCAVARRWGCWE